MSRSEFKGSIRQERASDFVRLLDPFGPDASETMQRPAPPRAQPSPTQKTRRLPPPLPANVD